MDDAPAPACSSIIRLWYVVAPKIFNHGILQRNFRKMTIRWSFSYVSFVKLSLYNTIHLQHNPFLWTQNIIIEPVHEISNKELCATSKGSNQPAHMCSLIRAVAHHLNILFGVSELKGRLHTLV